MVERPIISRVDTHNEEYESFAHLRGRKRKEESFVWVARMARRFDIRVEASCGAGKDSKEGTEREPRNSVRRGMLKAAEEQIYNHLNTAV